MDLFDDDVPLVRVVVSGCAASEEEGE